MEGTEVQALLETGQSGVAEWNLLRQDGFQLPVSLSFYTTYGQPNEALDLRGVDLGGCDLQGNSMESANFTDAHLFRTDFSGADIVGTRFIGAHMVNAILEKTAIMDTRFEGADMRGARMSGIRGSINSFRRARMADADLSGASLDQSDFSFCDLKKANLIDADLRGSTMIGCDLSGACLQGADLSNTNIKGANLSGANLSSANLTGAILEEARMLGTELQGANLHGASVYGISAWDLKTDGSTQQSALNIGRHGESLITVDDLEVAQFMYLLMNNARLRGVIDTITSKVVLILGRFTPERKKVLDAMRKALQGQEFGYVPIVFDFDKPASRSTTETVATLAGMARFIVADLSDAKSVLQELMSIVPVNPSLPVQPILLDSQQEPGMLDFFTRYPWFLETHLYADPDSLISRLGEVLHPAIEQSEQMRDEKQSP